jgi:hypothetical protein
MQTFNTTHAHIQHHLYICTLKFKTIYMHIFKTIYMHLSPVYTTLNFWYGTDNIGTRTSFLVLGLPIFRYHLYALIQDDLYALRRFICT